MSVIKRLQLLSNSFFFSEIPASKQEYAYHKYASLEPLTALLLREMKNQPITRLASTKNKIPASKEELFAPWGTL